MARPAFASADLDPPAIFRKYLDMLENRRMRPAGDRGWKGPYAGRKLRGDCRSSRTLRGSVTTEHHERLPPPCNEPEARQCIAPCFCSPRWPR
jgi:hypothetical protein